MSVIRRLAVSDAAAIVGLCEEVHRAAKVPIGPLWSAQQIAEACQCQTPHFGWVLTSDDDEIEAFVLAQELPDAWEIGFLATAPAAVGQGRMRQLLGYLISQLPAEKALWLEVHEANNPARCLYRAFGFREVGQRPRYYADGGTAILYNYG